METPVPDPIIPEPAPENAPWSFGPADAALAAAGLALVVGVALPAAWHLRREAQELDRQRTHLESQVRVARSTLQFIQGRRAAHAQFRRTVERYVATVEARPSVPWSTAVAELSRRRPAGVWTTRISGHGPRFRAEVAAARPELLARYAQSLKESPYVDYVEGRSGAGSRTELVGRWTGE